MAELKVIRWPIDLAAREFGMNRATLSHRIASAGVLRGADKMFSTTDICKAVFGDMDGEKLRLVREQANAVAIKNAAARRELLPTPDVQRHLQAVLVGLRAAILASSLLKDEKSELIINLRRLGEKVNVNERSDDGDEASVEDDDAASRLNCKSMG